MATKLTSRIALSGREHFVNSYISTVGLITVEVEWQGYGQFRLSFERNGKTAMLNKWQNESYIYCYSRQAMEETMKAGLQIVEAQGLLELSCHHTWMDGVRKGEEPRKVREILRK